MFLQKYDELEQSFISIDLICRGDSLDIISTSYYTCSLGNRELISYLVICFWKILSDFLIKSFMNAQMLLLWVRLIPKCIFRNLKVKGQTSSKYIFGTFVIILIDRKHLHPFLIPKIHCPFFLLKFIKHMYIICIYIIYIYI